MILGFFLNACILIAFISIAYIFLKDKQVKNITAISMQIIIGFIAGLLGIILMLYGVSFQNNTIHIDFRYIPILLTAIFCDFIPTIVAAIIIGLFRAIYFGISEASIIALITSLAAGLGFNLICNRLTTRKSKWIYSSIYLFLLGIFVFRLATDTTALFFEIIAFFLIGYTCVIFAVYLYSEYLCETIRQNNQLKNDAAKDFLTGLNNTRQFDLVFHNITQQTIKKDESLTLLYIDIDYFKTINDTYGHNVGDKILISLAKILTDTVRDFDVVSRNGGEEFSILLLDCSPEHALRIAERLRKKVEAHDFILSDEITLNITISIGVASFPLIENNIENLLKDADIALYKAKESGRNTVVLYSGV